MIIGLGIDLVDMDRIKAAYDKYGVRFLQKFLTQGEIASTEKILIPYIAGRFAVKEAAVKALGTGFSNGISACQIETSTNALGKPALRFLGMAEKRAIALGIKNTHLSISHERRMAVGLVILED